MLTQNMCQNCGGITEREGNFYVCQHCGTKWAIITEDAMQVKLQNAWESLRCNEFDRAAELFEDIIIDDKNSFEAYWGKALATNCVVFVTDFNESKKVPTCNNITENSFIENSDVKKAISLAPQELAENYRELAEKIEKIRIEWLEKASKEQPYDVFICFKDSDRENNIDRTPDSYAAQELYTALVDEGYRVFFSRVSLRDKISEQYEPYIYNALKTAKVMIVYGEKPEYFNAVWLKNEWNRFKVRIEKGEKHKNSLVVAYKNMNANDLPVVLKSRQCMDASSMTFYNDLSKHIKKVIELSEQNVHLDRIKIEGGQISKKASRLSVNSVQTREIGIGAAAETDISEKQTINLIHVFLQSKSWSDAESLIENVLFNNNGSAEALWCKILLDNRVDNEDSLQAILERRGTYVKGLDILEKLLSCASKAFAEHILDFFYNVNYADDNVCFYVLNIILGYNYKNREQGIEKLFANVTIYQYQKSFDLLIKTLDTNEVDAYIARTFLFAKNLDDAVLKEKYLRKILEVDESNTDALRDLLQLKIVSDVSVKHVLPIFESLLRYSKDTDEEVSQVLSSLASIKNVTPNLINYEKRFIRYYGGNISNLKDVFLIFAKKALSIGMFDDATFFFNHVLSIDKDCADAYWGICMVKIGAESESDIVSCTKLIKNCPEYTKYLTLVDATRQKKCIEISKRQIENNTIAKQDQEKSLAYNKERIKELERINKIISKEKPWIISILLIIQMVIFVAGAVVLISDALTVWTEALPTTIYNVLFAFCVCAILLQIFSVWVWYLDESIALAIVLSFVCVITFGILGAVYAVKSLIRAFEDIAYHNEKLKNRDKNLKEIELLLKENEELQKSIDSM